MAAISFERDHRLPDALLKAIGRVAVEWSYLEGSVEDAICYLSCLGDPFGRTITTHMSLDKRLDALLSIVHEIMPDTAIEKELKSLHKRIRRGEPSLEARRNTIIHSHWENLSFPDIAIQAQYRSRGVLKTVITPLRASQVEDLADEIAQVGHDVWNWTHCALSNLPPPWQKRLRAAIPSPARRRRSPQKNTSDEKPPRPPRPSRA